MDESREHGLPEFAHFLFLWLCFYRRLLTEDPNQRLGAKGASEVYNGIFN